MEITKTRSAGAKSQVKKKSDSAGGGSFASHLSGASEASSSSDVSPLSPVNSLFMLQEIDEEADSKKQAVEQGFDALDYLEKIRFGVLTGTVSSDTLKNLNSLIEQWRKNYNDPKLESIIDDIELRAAVELAKLESV